MTNHWRSGLAVLAALLWFSASMAAELKPTADVPLSWKAFWSSVRVEPAPPRNFLEGEYTGRVENFTDGKLSDATVRKWVLADMRRGRGDSYAAYNLRDDIANADIFGPPGLNGTGEMIQAYRDKGIEHIEMLGKLNMIAAAVVLVPKEVKLANPHLALTDYVVVQMYSIPSRPMTTVYRDGRREMTPGRSPERLKWQIDTGHFFVHPTLGPLWYQKMGWSCTPDETVLGKLCGKVKP